MAGATDGATGGEDRTDAPRTDGSHPATGSRLGRAVDRLTVDGSRLLARLGGLMILASALLVGVEVVLRNLFGLAVLNSFELTIYLFATAVALGLPHALAARAHIRIDILHARLPLPMRAVLDVAALASVAALAGLFAWHALGVARHSAALGATSNSGHAIPLVLPQGAWALALAWFALVAALLTLRAAADLVRGRVAAVTARACVPSEADATAADAATDGAAR